MNEKKVAGLRKLASPHRSKDNRKTVLLVKQLGRESILHITLYEGKNRQVRRMCEAMGLTIVKLRRVKFGPLTIRKIPLGAVRPLEKRELEALRRAVA
jgi:23S rRNA pseudouridine2605 synthase